MKFYARMDTNGRLRIPKQILDVLQYKPGTYFEVTIVPITDKNKIEELSE